MSRFVRPEVATLTLGNGDQLTIRRRLSAAEQLAAYARLYTEGENGRLKMNPLDSGIGLIEAYLLDWTLADDDGIPVVIRPDKNRAPDLDVVRAALGTLDYGSLIEIKEAIETHERSIRAARETEKKSGPDGATPPSAISGSPDAVAGVLTPSGISIPTITPSS